MSTTTEASLRHRAWRALDPRARAHGLSPVNIILAVLILVSVALAVAETEATLARFARVMVTAEMTLGLLFAIEYVARIWVAPEAPSGSRARLRFVLSPAGLADLGAVISAFLPFASAGLLLRLVRLLRLLRLAKLGRLSRAWSDMAIALSERREALALSLGISLVAVLVTATALYLVEGPSQPEAFGSIPRAAWWAVNTLTTIGYGDVYPMTLAGRILGSIASVCSIGLVALPAGILAAAFSDAMKSPRADRPAE